MLPLIQLLTRGKSEVAGAAAGNHRPRSRAPNNSRYQRHGKRENGKESYKLKLSALKPSDHGKITKIEASGRLKRRLSDMGVLVGEDVKVEEVAPLGGPIKVTIKNYSLSFRKSEAENIHVETSTEA